MIGRGDWRNIRRRLSIRCGKKREGAVLFEQALTMVIIALGFLLVVASVVLPRLVKSRGMDSEPSSGSGRPVSEDDLRSLQRIEDGIIRLEESSRELFGRLDTRSRALIRLIEEAEIRIQKLEDQERRMEEAQ